MLRQFPVAGFVVLALAVVAVALLAACGGGSDKEDAEQAVRDFVKASNARDADELCDHLLSKEFIEQSTGATGDRAHAACKQQVASLTKEFRIELGKLGAVRVDGDRARVTATIRTQGVPQRRVFRLRKEDGDWRLAGGPG